MDKVLIFQKVKIPITSKFLIDKINLKVVLSQNLYLLAQAFVWI